MRSLALGVLISRKAMHFAVLSLQLLIPVLQIDTFDVDAIVVGFRLGSMGRDAKFQKRNYLLPSILRVYRMECEN